jgi:hypothetical protein
MTGPAQPRIRAPGLARIGGLAVLTCQLGCAGGQDVTSEAIDRARQLWSRAGILDYDLEWTVRGPNNAHYFVTVHGGEVRTIESLQPDGHRIPLKPPQPRFYGVDGLLLTISDELAQLKTDQPFGQPKGTKVVLRFKCDPKLGYPLWYRRDVLGTSQSMSIDVVRLGRPPAAR